MLSSRRYVCRSVHSVGVQGHSVGARVHSFGVAARPLHTLECCGVVGGDRTKRFADRQVQLEHRSSVLCDPVSWGVRA